MTNRRTADAIVTLTDVDFINTRGIALDGAQVSDGPGYNTDATVGSIDYEIRSVVGGNLRIGAPNSSDAITLVGGLGFQPIGIRRDKLGSIYFEHVPSALPGPPTQPPGFEIREVYGDGSGSDWVHVAVPVVSDGEIYPDELFTAILIGSSSSETTVQLVDDGLLHASPGLLRGGEYAQYSDDARPALAALEFSNGGNDLVLTATTPGTEFNDIEILVAGASGIGQNPVVAYNSGAKQLTITVDNSGVTTVEAVRLAVNAEGTFTAAHDESAEGATYNSAALIPAGDVGVVVGNTGNSGGAPRTLYVYVQSGYSTKVEIAVAINAEGTFTTDVTSHYEYFGEWQGDKLTPLASLADMDLFASTANRVIATLTNVSIVDPYAGMVLRYRDAWDPIHEDPDIPYEFPRDLRAGFDDFLTQQSSLRLHNVDAQIAGLTLREGSGLTGVWAWSSDVEISDSRFLPSYVADGVFSASNSAIRSDSSELTVSNTLFQDLNDYSSSGIVNLDVNSNVVIDQSTFLNNDTSSGVIVVSPIFDYNINDGVPTRFRGSLTLRDSLVAGTYGGIRGGAIEVRIDTVVRDECTLEQGELMECDPLNPTYSRIAGNRVPYRLIIDGSTIQDNLVAYSGTSSLGNHEYAMGGGLSLTGPIDAFITNSTITHNQAGGRRDEFDLGTRSGPNGLGGGIAAIHLHSLRIDNSTLSDNYAASTGGAIFAYDVDQIELTNVTITDNGAGEQGGGLFVVGGVLVGSSPGPHGFESDYGQPEGYFLPLDDEVVTLVNSIVTGNYAEGRDLEPGFGDSGIPQSDPAYPTHQRSTSIVGPGAYAVDYTNTHDLWFARAVPSFFAANPVFAASLQNYHALSNESRNNIIGVGPTSAEDPNFPLQDGVAGNIVGTSALPKDPKLAVLGDYGGPNFTHAILLGAGVNSPAIHAGVNLPLIKPTWIDSSSYRYDSLPAYNLQSETVALQESSIIPVTGAVTADLDRRRWNTGGYTTADGVFHPVVGSLTFGFHEEESLDRIVLWSASDSGPSHVYLSFTTDGEEWTEEIEANIDWSGSNGGSRVIRFNGAATTGVTFPVGVPNLVDGGGYLPATAVRMRISTSSGQGASLGEVRFQARPAQDQRGGVFDRVAGASIDIGAYESPVEYNFATLPAPQSPAAAGFSLEVSSTADVIDRQLSFGQLSLREAIILANLYPNAQSIALPYALGGGRVELTRGELRITDDVTIAGVGRPVGARFEIDASLSHGPIPADLSGGDSALPGHSGVYDQPETHYPEVVPGKANALGSRVLNIDDGVDVGASLYTPISATLEGLELTGGFVLGSGGGIRSTEDLTILDSSIRDNLAYRNARALKSGGYRIDYEYLLPSGGGVYSVQGDLTIDHSDIVGNSAVASGGGIHFADGHVEITDSLIAENVVRRTIVSGSDEYDLEFQPFATWMYRGGGVAILGAAPGQSLIESSTIRDNVALAADQEYDVATAGFNSFEFGHDRVVERYRPSYGGGVYIDRSNVALRQSTISGNEAMQGGGVFVVGQMDYDDAPGVAYLELDRSTVSGNIAAVHLSPLNPQTTSNNWPVELHGAGIAVRGEADALLSYATITANRIDATYNTTTPTAAGVYFPEGQYYNFGVDPGPSATDYFGRLRMDHTVIAGNEGPTTYDPRYQGSSIYSSDAIRSSDLYFPSSGIHATLASNSILEITNSLIGDNRGIATVSDPNGYIQNTYYNGIDFNTGYQQSPLVNPADMSTALAWSAGGVPKPDARGNLIGGALMGEMYADFNGWPQQRFYGGYLDPLLDVLAYNGGATQTHAPLIQGPAPSTLILPTISAGLYLGGAYSGSLQDLVTDSLVGFPFDPYDNDNIGYIVTTPESLPYRGNELLLQLPIHSDPSWQTTSVGGAGTDYFAQPAVMAPNGVPSMMFDLGRRAILQEFIVWATSYSGSYTNLYSQYRAGVYGDDGYLHANNSEARSFRLEFFDGAGTTPVAVQEFTRPDLPHAPELTAPVSPLPGMSQAFVLDAPVTATRVRVTILDNYYDAAHPERGGDYVTLGQVRFVGDWQQPASAAYPSLVSPLIDRGAVNDAHVDQRGYPQSAAPTETTDIGAHEAGALPAGAQTIDVAFTNVIPGIVENEVGPNGVKVADLVVSNLRNVPLQFVLGGGSTSLFEIRTNAENRSLRQLWTKPGANLDFESIYAVTGSQLQVTVQVIDPTRATGGTSAVRTLQVPVVDVNDRPEYFGSTPTVSVSRDATPSNNVGIAVSTLLSSAVDRDLLPAPDQLGLAIVGVNVASLLNSFVEYRFASNSEWYKVPNLGSTQSRALLLPSTAFIRLNLDAQDAATLSAATIADAIRFRIWDGTLGAIGPVVAVGDVEGALSELESSGPFSMNVALTPRLGAPFTANDGATTYVREQAAVAVDGRGTSIHVYRENAGGLRIRRVSSSGSALGASISIASAGASAQNPQIVVANDGGVIVAWEQPDSSTGVYAQRFQLSGNTLSPVGGLLTLSAGTASLSKRLVSLAYVSAGESIIASWEQMQSGVPVKSFIGRFYWNGTTNPPAQELQGAVAGTAQQLAAVAVDPLGGKAHVAWLDGTLAVRVGSYNLSTNVWSPVAAAIPRPTVTSPRGGGTSSGPQIARIQLAIDAEGRPVVAWREATTWTYAPAVDGVSTEVDARIYTFAASLSQPWVDAPVLRTQSLQQNAGASGSMFADFSMAFDSGGRAALAWVQSTAGVTTTSEVVTTWLNGDGSLRGGPFAQIESGLWSQPSFAANPAGRFVLSARKTGSPNPIVGQRYELDPPTATTMSLVSGVFEVKATSADASRLVISNVNYGGTQYVAVNGLITTTTTSQVTKLVIRGGDEADVIDLRNFTLTNVPVEVYAGAGDDVVYAGPSAVVLDGGLGDDRYVVTNRFAGNVAIVDAGGADKLVLADWQGTKGALVVLGSNATQTITRGGSPNGVSLRLVTGNEIEAVESLEPGAPSHLVFSPGAKPLSAGAGKLVVSTLADELDLDATSVDLSLREALLWARTDDEPDLITFAPGLIPDDNVPNTVVFTLADVDQDGVIDPLVIDSQVDIRGVNKFDPDVVDNDEGDRIYIDGLNLSRVIRITADGRATLKHLSLKNGASAGDGGAVYAQGSLALYGVEIFDSTAARGGGVAFAGAATGATLQVFDSTIRNNDAAYGAGVAVLSGSATIDGTSVLSNGDTSVGAEGGGLWQADGTAVQVVNSTFSDNRATTGGGIYANVGSGSMSLVNVTNVLNRANAGGGVYVASSSSNRVLLQNSIIAGNITLGLVANDVGGSAASPVFQAGAFDSRNNVIGDPATTGGLVNGTSNNFVGDNGAIRPVATIVGALSNGTDGYPRYHAPVVGSIAINKIDVTLAANALTPAFDQRGLVPASGYTLRDVGAIEYAAVVDSAPPTLPNVEGHVLENAKAGDVVAVGPTGRVQGMPSWRGFNYEIVDGNFGGAFAIDPTTGTITVANAKHLDAERATVYLLRVRATQTRSTPVSVHGLVRIVVDNVNEAPQILGSASYRTTQSALSGAVLGSVIAVDPENQALTYSIAEATGAFAIDASTGRLTVADRTKLNGKTVFDFTLTVAETGANPLSATRTVHVDVAASPSSDPLPTDPNRPQPDFTTSHARELRFNPLANLANASTDALRVTFLSGNGALEIDYSSAGAANTSGTKTLTLGKLTAEADGTLKYVPSSNLVQQKKLTKVGEGGRYYYAEETVRYRITNLQTKETSEHSFVIEVTNSLPVFRSEFFATQDDRYLLGDTISVERGRAYQIDLAELFYDPDGDALEIEGFESTRATQVDHSDLAYPHIADGTQENFTAESKIGTESIWAGIGYKLDPSGRATDVRKLILEKVPSAPSFLNIYHTGEVADNDSDRFYDLSSSSAFTFEISISDGQIVQNKPVGPSFEVSLAPWNRPNNSLDRTSRLPWVDVTEVRDANGNFITPDVLNPKLWSVAAYDLQPGREGAAYQPVGGAAVDLVDGSFVVRHDLTLDGSGGSSEMALPGLVYDSAVADPRPIIEARLTPQDLRGLNLRNIDVTVRLIWFDHVNAVDQSGHSEPRQIVTEMRYEKPANTTDPWVFRFRPGETPLYSGVYHWEMEFEINVRTGNAITSPTDEVLTLRHSGDTAVVVQRTVAPSAFVAGGAAAPAQWNYKAQFGNGWALEGAPMLFVDDIRGTSLSASNNTQGDDRLILWFPGESLRVFKPGLAAAAGAARQDYADGVFTPINLQTGLEDPSEFGLLEYDTDSQDVPSVRYKTANGSVYRFERIDVAAPSGSSDFSAAPAWRLKDMSVSSMGNRTVVFNYNGSTRELVSIIGADGKQVDVTTPSANVVRFKLPGAGGHQTDLQLASSSDSAFRVGDLKKITQTTGASPADRVRAFTYDDGRMTSDKWMDGAASVRVVDYVFDTTTKLLSSVAFGEGTLKTTYPVAIVAKTALVNVTTAPTTSGAVVTRAASSAAAPPTAPSRTATVTLVTDIPTAGDWLTKYTFDVADNVIAQDSHFGTSASASNKIAGETWTYDQFGSPISYVDQGNRATYFSYDYAPPAGVAAFKKNQLRGNLIRSVSFNGVTEFEYETDDKKGEAVGRLKKVIGPSGIATSYERDAQGQRTKLQIGSSYGETWEYFPTSSSQSGYVAEKAGLLKKHVDELGLTTEYDYEPATRRLASMRVIDRGLDGVASADDQITFTAYQYDVNGYLLTERVHAGVDASAPVLMTTEYDFDDTGLLRSVTLKNGVGTILSKSRTDYAPDGLPLYVYAGDGGDESRTAYQYDKRGLVQSTTIDPAWPNAAADPDYVTSYLYYTDGSLKEVTRPDGSKVQTVVDPLYRLSATGPITPKTTTTSVNGAATSSSYDGTNVTATFVSAATTSVVDSLGRTLLEKDELTGSQTTYKYGDARHDLPTRIAERANLGAGKLTETLKVTNDATDLVAQLAYDQLGRMIYESNPEEAARKYVFDELGHVTKVTLDQVEYGSDFTFVNDASGNVTSQTERRRSALSPAGVDVVTTYAYDQQGRMRKTTDFADGDANPRSALVDYAFESLGAVGSVLKSTQTDRNGVASYAWLDAAGRVVRSQNPLGGQVENLYDTRNNVTTTTFTPAAGDAGGQVRKTGYEYDKLDRLRKTTDFGDPQATVAPNLVTYVDYLLPTAATNDTDWDVVSRDASGAETKVMYDPSGRIIAMQQPEPGVDATGVNDPDRAPLTLYSYEYLASKLAVSVTKRDTTKRAEPNPDAYDETHVTRQIFSAAGDLLASGVRVSALASNGPSIASASTVADFFNNGGDAHYDVRQVNRYSVPGRVVESGDGKDERVKYEYDVATTGLALPALVDQGGKELVRYTYDSAGNRLSMRQIRSGEDKPNEISGEPDNVTKWTYEKLNRVTSESITIDVLDVDFNVVGSEPKTSTWTYNGLTTVFVDRDGRRVESTVDYSARTNTVIATFPENLHYPSLPAPQTAAYDDLGYKSITTFHSNGAVKKVQDEWFSTATAAPYAGKVFDTTRGGQLGTAGNDASVVTFGYDEFGRNVSTLATSKAFGDAAPQNLLETTYTANGVRDLATWKLAAGAPQAGDLVLTTDYHVDALNRIDGLTQVVSGGTTKWTNVALNKAIFAEYNSDGSVERVRRFNTAAYALPNDDSVVSDSIYGYAPDGTTYNILHRSHLDYAYLPTASYTTLADENGRISSRTRQLYNDGEEVFTETAVVTRDDAGQITTVGAASGGDVANQDPVTGINDNLDDAGNRLPVGRQNRLLSDNAYVYSYDGAGNLIEKREIASGNYYTYVWDHRGLLLQAAYHGVGGSLLNRTDYAYDALGRQIVKKHYDLHLGTTATGYVYDGSRVAMEIDLNGGNFGKASVNYVYGPNGDLQGVDQGGKTLWMFADTSGVVRTIAAVDDGDWQEIHRNYDDYGLRKNFIRPDGAGGSPDGVAHLGAALQQYLKDAPEIYQGARWDEDAQLFNFGGRWYDPFSGRYATDAGGTNGYQFMENDPVRERGQVQDSGLTREDYTQIYGDGIVGGFNYLVGESVRGLVGDQRLAAASTFQLVAGTTAVAAGAVFGAYYLVGAAGLVGTSSTALGSVGSALNAISLGASAGSFFLSGEGLTDLSLDTVSSLADVVGGSKVKAAYRLGAVGVGVAANLFQGGRSAVQSYGDFSEGNYVGGTLHAAGATLGFGAAGVRGIELATESARLLTRRGAIGGRTRVLDPLDDLARFRSKSKLTNSDTLARVEINGRRYFGVNSSAQPPDALSLRQDFLSQIQTQLGKLGGKHLNRVRALTHAEGHVLMRAFMRNAGDIGKNVTIHVDRTTCNFCSGENGVTLLRELMGIEELTIISPGRTVVLN